MLGHKLVLAKGYGEADRNKAGDSSDGADHLRHRIHLEAIHSGRNHEALRAGAARASMSRSLSICLSIEWPGRCPRSRNLLQQNSGLPAWDDLPEFQDVDTGDARRFELLASSSTRLLVSLLSTALGGGGRSTVTPTTPVLAAVVERITGTRHDEVLGRALSSTTLIFNRQEVVRESARVTSAGQRAVG